MGEQKSKKKTTDELISEAAEKSARALLNLQRGRENANHYAAMESLLRAYPKRRQMIEHPEEFEFFRTEHSKDISIAPPPGSGVVDKIELATEYAEAQMAAFKHEAALLYETDFAITPFKNLPEFNVIRLLYFNEDINGNDRGPDAKRLTWEEIAQEMESIGISRTITVLRRWRSRLVRDFVTMMFGADGALAVSGRNDRKRSENGGADESDEGQVHSEG